MSNKIFDGIRILDFTQVIAGSYATTIMGDMGAEVIKVEPFTGDSLRFAGPMFNDVSGFFMLNNRNKKSISINLKEKEGIEIINKIIRSCDVLIQNFKPGVMEKFGFGYEDVCTIKPDIVYVAVSGYGQRNRYSERPAYDNMIQAETGLASLNGLPKDSIPLRSPLSISDYTAGIYGAMAISSALYHRKNTGEGQQVDIAMFDSLISIMDNSFLIYQANQDKLIDKVGEKKSQVMEKIGLKSTGNRHSGAAPHGYYKTKDSYIAHMSLTNEMWHKLLTVVGREDLINDPKYATLEQRRILWQEIDAIIESWTSQITTMAVVKIFTENRLPCGIVRAVDKVYNDPHCRERGIFEDVEHPIGGKVSIANVPVKFSKTPTKIERHSPLLGEHNYEVLMNIAGFSKEQIDNLIKKRVLGAIARA